MLGVGKGEVWLREEDENEEEAEEVIQEANREEVGELDIMTAIPDGGIVCADLLDMFKPLIRGYPHLRHKA